MAKKTFEDVRELLDASGYKIQKDPAWTCRRYIVESSKGEKLPIRYTPTMDQMYADIKKQGIQAFLKKQDASDNDKPGAVKPAKAKAKAGSKRAKAVVTVADPNFVPRALRNRQSAMESDMEPTAPIDEDNIALSSEVVECPQMSQEYIQTASVAKINYGKKMPKQFDGYYFPNSIGNMVTRISIGRNVYLQGKAGTGKSELVQKLAKFFNVKVMRINFNIGTTEQHMIGKFVVKDGHTQFIYGIIPLAMRHGWWVLLDEIDYAQPEHLSALQAVLEGNSLMIAQNENEEIHPHENFRIFATGNTKGRGDESQSYTGTNFLNMAFLDRWSVFELDYTKEEAKICSEYIQDPILIDQLMQYFKLLRKAADPKEGELGNVSFSTRRIIQICEVLSLGESLKDAMTYELWSRYDEHEIHIMEELAYDVWEREHYFKGWKLGMEHAPEPEIIQQP